MTATARSPAPRSRLDPEVMPRRDFLGLGALGAMAAALLAALLGILRLPKPSVSPTPARKFRVTLPGSLAPGEPYHPPGRSVVLFRDTAGVWAVSTVCTHLGCIVRSSASGFECPCHGSQFAADGAVTRGPAPKALPWLAVRSLGGGTVLVDEGASVAPGTKVAL